MPLTDRREIEFDTDAIIEAVSTSLRAAESVGLPGLAPSGVRFYPKDGEIDVLYGQAQTLRAVRVKPALVGALLVAYCIRARIPMPRKGHKAVRIEAESVILAFRTQFAKIPTPAAETEKMTTALPVASFEWIEPNRLPR